MKALTTANRLAKIPASGTMEVGRKVRELRASNRDIIHLGAGTPTPSPNILKQAFNFAAELNTLGDPAGLIPLRAAIAKKLQADQNISYDPETEIVVTVGAKQALYAALLALIENGDEVAILDPAWVTYGPSIQLAGAVPRPFVLNRTQSNRLEVSSLAGVLSSRTRIAIINTPHNPTGRVFTREELQPFADLAREQNLWVISDESFDKFVFDGNRHVGIASLPGMKKRTVVLQSFSKAYGFIGGRVGYLAAPAPVARLVRRFNEHVLSCVSPYMQSVALAALAEEPAWTESLQAAYRQKRDFVVAEVNKIPGLSCDVPEGTFYVWTDISSFAESSETFAARLLEHAGVAVTPGSAFGANGEGYIRFNLAGPMQPIEEGLQRIATFVKSR